YNMLMSVTKEQIQHIALLAKLKLTEEELDRYEKEFNSILEYIAKVNECDVSGIQDEHNLEDYVGIVHRDDKVVKSTISKDEMLRNATKGRTKNGYIAVSKIIDKGA